MKIFFAGAFEYSWYEEACASALEELGHTVTRFSWRDYLRTFTGKLESHFVIPGPASYRLNRALVAAAVRSQPDTIFIWRGTYIWPETLRALKSATGATLACYNNDDAFSPFYSSARNIYLRRVWRYFKTCIPEYDIHFVVRRQNIDEYRRAGARRVHFLKHFYVKTIHRPVELTAQERDRFGADAVFVGHYENDGRLDHLRALANAGISLRLFGSGWNKEVLGDLYNYFGAVRPVYLEDYTKALCAAKLCLSFVSKLNRDTYTSRTFEIPACGALLVSERTSEIAEFYKEGEEAIFFSTPEELIEKARGLLVDDERRRAIAQAGYRRCLADGHDAVSRMREFVAAIADLTTETQSL